MMMMSFIGPRSCTAELPFLPVCSLLAAHCLLLERVGPSRRVDDIGARIYTAKEVLGFPVSASTVAAITV